MTEMCCELLVGRIGILETTSNELVLTIKSLAPSFSGSIEEYLLLIDSSIISVKFQVIQVIEKIELSFLSYFETKQKNDKFDSKTIITALLHDVVEDTNKDLKDIKINFGNPEFSDLSEKGFHLLYLNQQKKYPQC